MKEALDLSMVPYGRQQQQQQQQQMGDDKSESGNEMDIKPMEKMNRQRFMAEPVIEPVSTAIKAVGMKLQVRYRECMRNHAASIGGHANDGCGEFMQGVEGLRCAACGCHRNFHRKEVQGGGGGDGLDLDHHLLHQAATPPPLIYNTNPRWEKKKIQMDGGGFPSLSLPQHHTSTHFHHRNNSGSNLNGGGLFGNLDHDNQMNEDRRSETPEERGGGGDGGGGGGMRSSSKRFRTKFTLEQKEKMLEFADRLGWRIQRHDDVALSQFCLEVGVKRQVLKVWMHNNKNTFRKRDNINVTSSPPPPLPPPPPPPAVQLVSPPPSIINGV